YETTFPWCVLKTHLHVASDLAGIPKFRLLRTPNWLRFDFIEHVDCKGEVTFDIALDEIDGGVSPGDSVVIAARAVVEGEGADGTHPRCLLGDKCVAWGEGPRFRPRLPAMYFTYDIQEQFLCGGSESKCVFLTSSSHNGNLGGLARGDEICRARAAEAGLPGAESFLAWLSDDTASPSTRFTQATVPYKLVNGTTIAPDWSGLVDGMLDAPINVTEQGSVLPANLAAWTGTAPSGGALGPDCAAWSVADSANMGRIGHTTLVNGRWTSGGIFSCDPQRRLFCFQQ
ncbi:MAG: hypothetical protein ACREJ0_02525, partial [Geminicoccaceae bacterium]